MKFYSDTNKDLVIRRENLLRYRSWYLSLKFQNQSLICMILINQTHRPGCPANTANRIHQLTSSQIRETLNLSLSSQLRVKDFD